MKAANEESTESYFCIGNCYLNGLGVEKDEKEAARWFLKAAELGEPDSMFHLASEWNRTANYRQNISIRQQKPNGNLLLEL